MFRSRQVILKYTYRLTSIQLGDFGGVPHTDITVEDISVRKHCGKKRRQSSFTYNTVARQEVKASLTTNYYHPFSTYSTTPPSPHSLSRMILHHILATNRNPD
jgi:hypothetical protein